MGDGVDFSLYTERVSYEVALRHGVEANAELVGATDRIVARNGPELENFSILKNGEPTINPTAPTLKLACPEVDDGMGCAHAVDVFEPRFNSPELFIARWLENRAAVARDIAGGRPYLSDNSDPSGRSNIAGLLLGSGTLVSIGPDLESGGSEFGHSPLSVEDIQMIVSGLEGVDWATFTDRSNQLG